MQSVRSTRASVATAATSRSDASRCHVDHPLVEHKLSLLRERSTSTADFRRVGEVAAMLTYEATKDFPIEEVAVETPLESGDQFPDLRQEGRRLPVASRLASDMLGGVLSLISSARGFIWPSTRGDA